MGEVVRHPAVTKLDRDIKQVVNDEAAENLESAIVIGWDKDGDFYFDSTLAAGPEVLWLLEICRLSLMKATES